MGVVIRNYTEKKTRARIYMYVFIIPADCLLLLFFAPDVTQFFERIERHASSGRIIVIIDSDEIHAIHFEYTTKRDECTTKRDEYTTKRDE